MILGTSTNVLRVWQFPTFLGAPVTSAIDDASEVIRRAVLRQLNHAHRNLVAYSTSNDRPNNIVARLNYTISELYLTARTVIRPAAQSAFNRCDMRNVTAIELWKPDFGWVARAWC